MRSSASILTSGQPAGTGRPRAPILVEPPAIRGTVHIRVERCKGCELCIDYCPTRVLALSPDFNAKGYHYPTVVSDTCVTCQACFAICPEFAIFATPAHAPAGASGAGGLA